MDIQGAIIRQLVGCLKLSNKVELRKLRLYEAMGGRIDNEFRHKLKLRGC